MGVRSRTGLALNAFLLGSAALMAGVGALAAPETVTANLTLDPQGAAKIGVGYFPIRVALATEKPASVRKEPKYAGTPRYGSVRVGATTIALALDEPADADWKIYVDVNGNGDLTDDGDGQWSAKRTNGNRTQYGVNRYKLPVTWDLGDGKTAMGEYGLAFYRFSDQDALLMYREAVRVGELTLDGKAHKAALVENDADEIYNKTVASVDEARKSRPVWLLIDLNDNGRFESRAGEVIDVRAPFKLGDATYEANISTDGGTLKLAPTTKMALDLTPKAPARPPLLAAGTPAPAFKAEAWGGGEIDLARYRGKVVLLDFWATWCGPCRVSMPHLEQVYQAVKNQGVVVLAVCVWDDKEAYMKWVPENQDKYHFQFAYDPAGRDGNKSIAGSMYKVSGIPTTYVIDREGKVADAIVGYREGDTRIEEALRKLGVKVEKQPAP